MASVETLVLYSLKYRCFEIVRDAVFQHCDHVSRLQKALSNVVSEVIRKKCDSCSVHSFCSWIYQNSLVPKELRSVTPWIEFNTERFVLQVYSYYLCFSSGVIGEADVNSAIFSGSPAEVALKVIADEFCCQRFEEWGLKRLRSDPVRSDDDRRRALFRTRFVLRTIAYIAGLRGLKDCVISMRGNGKFKWLDELLDHGVSFSRWFTSTGCPLFKVLEDMKQDCADQDLTKDILPCLSSGNADKLSELADQRKPQPNTFFVSMFTALWDYRLTDSFPHARFSPGINSSPSLVQAFGNGAFSAIRKGLLGFSDHKLSQLSSSSSPQFALIVQLSVSLCVEISKSTDNLLKGLVEDPASFKDSYLPCMPDDPEAMVRRAVEAGHSGLSQRWIVCPNNHVIFMYHCDQPTQTITCIDCGARIGGDQHAWAFHSLQLAQAAVDKSPKGYSVEKNSRIPCGLTFRELNPLSLRLLSFIQHLTLLLSSLHSEAACQQCFTVRPAPDLVTHLLDELFCDWKNLIEITRESPDGLVSKLLSCIPGFVNSLSGVSSAQQLNTNEARVRLETAFSAEVERLWKSASSSLLHNAEPEEIKDDPFFSVPPIELLALDRPIDDGEFQKYGSLWIPRRSDKSFLRFLDQVTASNGLPLLKYFVENRFVLQSLPFLSEAVIFANLVCSTLSGKLAENDTIGMTARDVIDRVKEELFKLSSPVKASDVSKWFESYQKMWSFLYTVVSNFECQQLSVKYEMNLDAPGGLLLLTEKNLGVYPRVYFSSASDRYNTILDLANVQECKEFRNLGQDNAGHARVFRYMPLKDQQAAISGVFTDLTERIYEMGRWSHDDQDEAFVLTAVEGYLKKQLAVLVPTVISLDVFKFSDAIDAENIVRTPLQDLSSRITKLFLGFTARKRQNAPLPTAAAAKIRMSLSSSESFANAVQSLRTLVNLLEAIDFSFLKEDKLIVSIAEDLSLRNFSEGVGQEVARFCKLTHLPDLIKIIVGLQFESNAALGGSQSVDVDEDFRKQFSREFIESRQILEKLRASTAVVEFKWSPSELRVTLLADVCPKLKGLNAGMREYIAADSLWERLGDGMLEEGQGTTSPKWFEYMKEHFPEFKGAHLAAFIDLLRELDETSAPEVITSGEEDEKNQIDFDTLYGSNDLRMAAELSERLQVQLMENQRIFNWDLEEALKLFRSQSVRSFLESRPSFANLSIWQLLTRILQNHKIQSGWSEETIEITSERFSEIKGCQFVEFVQALEDAYRRSSAIQFIQPRIDPTQLTPPPPVVLASEETTDQDFVVVEQPSTAAQEEATNKDRPVLQEQEPPSPVNSEEEKKEAETKIDNDNKPVENPPVDDVLVRVSSSPSSPAARKEIVEVSAPKVDDRYRPQLTKFDAFLTKQTTAGGKKKKGKERIMIS
eukprot:TRINITY_DN11025_c0_g4_i1.p1 TRINITY_DN11025_c0_g4~~TRINITY_DN11025_c0_g4_i1.p1  ORF type:complete len:1427 (-),score=356.73 TRINITY_DN11025_c0_g4_i1:97-4317(-)